jgi:hypothetical protein
MHLCLCLARPDDKLKVVLLIAAEIRVAHKVQLGIDAALGGCGEGKRQLGLGLKGDTLDGKEPAESQKGSTCCATAI